MKYKDLPKFDTLTKIVQVSFSTPKKNLMMYRLFESLKSHITFIESERNKLLKRYGIDEGNGKYKLQGENYIAYSKAWNELIELDIDGEIPKVEFTEKDFDEENCSYPPEKEMWPSGLDIATFLELCDKLKGKSGD